MLDGVLRRLPLARLEELNLYNCMLTGPILEELAECKALKVLQLGANQLTGPIPEWLGKCEALKKLDLSRNRLTGPIPEALGECEALEVLWLDNVQKEGIPEALRQRQQAGRLEIY